MSNRFSWGDTVKVKIAAPTGYRPGEIAFVCGLRAIKNNEKALEFGSEPGEYVYIVEFLDGSSVEVAEKWLLPAEND